jgi:ubiquinone/menaquinone biosynthesis C-methylase UbiE
MFEPDLIVRSYYESIAAEYDSSRFNNSYGRYLDDWERRILCHWLPNSQERLILDLACGTGRFLELATTGLDASLNMLEIAGQKYPDRLLIHADACEIPLLADRYDAIFSLHLFMHLSQEQISNILAECHRILRPGGIMVFDIPSALRRNLVRYQPADWHGATSLSIPQIRLLTMDRWHIEEWEGLPIHRLPSPARDRVRMIDRFLCQTVLKSIASFLFVKLVKV